MITIVLLLLSMSTASTYYVDNKASPEIISNTPSDNTLVALVTTDYVVTTCPLITLCSNTKNVPATPPIAASVTSCDLQLQRSLGPGDRFQPAGCGGQKKDLHQKKVTKTVKTFLGPGDKSRSGNRAAVGWYPPYIQCN